MTDPDSTTDDHGARVVRAVFEAYLAGDRAAAEQLAPNFVFTSPQGDHRDKAAYFERCFSSARG